MTGGFLINHVWQSTCFVAIAGLLAVLLRKNRPKVRYWVWLSASLKFLVPFAMLVSLGNLIPQPESAISVQAPVVPHSLVQIAEPFSPTSYASVPARTDWMPVAIGIVWAGGFVAIAYGRCRSFLRIRAALRASTPVELPIPIPAFIGPTVAEPGIVGFLRPVLALPAQLLERLNPRQLDAVLAHELSHVRRRDNLFAAIHMVVEAIFWFHPLVWWIGSRLVEERELACDEEVLRMGCEPTDYAAGILKVCRFYTESALPCVSGVTGADVKKRLRGILTGNIARELNFGRKAILMAAGMAALAAPIAIGVLNAPAARAQSTEFEVASVKPNSPDSMFSGSGAPFLPRRSGDRVIWTTNPQLIIRYAYDIRSFQLAQGKWLNGAYDVEAKFPATATEEQVRLMFQALLRDRFHLKFHWETKELPVYSLIVARGGPKLTEWKQQETPKKVIGKTVREGMVGNYSSPEDPHHVVGHKASIPVLAAYFADALRSVVVDKTGLPGEFDFELTWTSDEAPLDPPEPSVLSAAMQRQLGLRLEAGKGPVQILVIERLEKPTAN